MTSKEALRLLIPQDIETFRDFYKKYNCGIKNFIFKDLEHLERLKKLEKAVEKFNDYLKKDEMRSIPKHSIRQTFNRILNEEMKS